jgi:hypothetical protein
VTRLGKLMRVCDNRYVEVTLQHLEAGSQLRLVRRQVGSISSQR